MGNLFVVFFGLAAVIMVASLVVFAIVFVRVGRFSGKVFQQLEREMQHRADEMQPQARISCPHCGSAMLAGERCESCGAKAE